MGLAASKIEEVGNSRIQLVQSFREAVENLDPRINAHFEWAIREGMEILCLRAKDIADEFTVSQPTVSRWLRGQSVPVRPVRQAIYSWLIEESRKACEHLQTEEEAFQVEILEAEEQAEALKAG